MVFPQNLCGTTPTASIAILPSVCMLLLFRLSPSRNTHIPTTLSPYSHLTLTLLSSNSHRTLILSSPVSHLPLIISHVDPLTLSPSSHLSLI